MVEVFVNGHSLCHACLVTCVIYSLQINGEKIIMEVSTQAVDEKGSALYHDAQQIKVTDSEGYDNASEFAKTLKAYQKEVKEHFRPMKEKTKAAYQEVVSQEKARLDPAVEAEGIVKKEMNRHYVEQQRLRAIEEAKARKAAIKQEQAKKEAEKKGKPIPVFKPAPVVQTETPSVKGVSHKSIWKYEVTNEKVIPREYLTPDLVKIGKIARALKAETHIKGVRVWEEKSMAVRG